MEKWRFTPFISLCPLPPTFNQTYYYQLIPKCEKVFEPFCILLRKSLISLECYCPSRMLEEQSGNECGLFSFSFLLLTWPAAYLFNTSPHICFSLYHILSLHTVLKSATSLECCVFVSSLPPKSPSGVLFSVVKVRTLVIPEIPDCKIQKYFSTRTLIYRYVCIINMPLLFLHCRQRSERIVLCCQINTSLIFIRPVTQCVPFTSHTGLNTNKKNDAASGEWAIC